MPIRAFAIDDASASFECARDSAMVQFIKTLAHTYEQDGYARTYILADANEPKLQGFYTLSMYAVRPKEFPSEEQAGLPRHQLPTALLGQVARDDRATKVGRDLVKDAVKRVYKLAKEIGCIGIVLHAQNEQLLKYYESEFGFRALPRTTYPRLMILTMTDLRAPLDSK